MARRANANNKAKDLKKYIVTTPVKNYCGIGAGGIQFAYGKAEVCEGTVLEWYREHGYGIEEVGADNADGGNADGANADGGADE